MKKLIVLTFIIAVAWIAGCKKESVCDGPPKVNAGMDITAVDQTSVTLLGTTSAMVRGVQ